MENIIFRCIFFSHADEESNDCLVYFRSARKVSKQFMQGSGLTTWQLSAPGQDCLNENEDIAFIDCRLIA